MAQRITYAGGEFVVADIVADALLDYALTLARRARVDVVHVRTRRIDGSVGRMRLLIGDGMPLASEAKWEESTAIDSHPDDEAAAALIRHRAAAFGRSPTIRLDGEGNGHSDLLSAYDEF
ncbi:hypothetical protein AVP42_01738 [Agromyces sp. NDB4Y10]|uniref:hypothetical protein n=1 Tax=Agromyces sp. NDB4Y10 TaxID=1775951 RepID=UPI0007B2BAD6|nr:hypothetical protein [Agromyces sp. NDB4Y10]KZE93602.1 hypothetical protein AVP42_01738 [Agromyces sp. NDB4Y10]